MYTIIISSVCNMFMCVICILILYHQYVICLCVLYVYYYYIYTVHLGRIVSITHIYLPYLIIYYLRVSISTPLLLAPCIGLLLIYTICINIIHVCIYMYMCCDLLIYLCIYTYIHR